MFDRTRATATALFSGQDISDDSLNRAFHACRALTTGLASPLSDADATLQSMPDASPAKWHLAHSSWFFEAFVLRDHVPQFQPYDARYPFLFNSYYEAEGPRQNRASRGMLSRPSLSEILAYRDAVTAGVQAALPQLSDSARQLVLLGIQHEQQHQELLLTDQLHHFSVNPLQPAMWPDAAIFTDDPPPPPALGWIEGRQGVIEVGASGNGFAFDSETPRHPTMLAPHALADRTITNAEWCSFIEEGGYQNPRLWLSDGWAWVQANQVQAPLYWEQGQDGWTNFTLTGRRPLNPSAPVTHISFFEADAFAAWAGARLPTEFEWESAASTLDPSRGNFLDDAGPVTPHATADGQGDGLQNLFGNVWEWCGSAYRPYPGFRAPPGAVGEYNGKFMSGQFVLRGGSCATPRGHARASYRNFFYPHQRWQFTGLRLAKDL